MASPKKKKKKHFALRWVVEPLEEESSFYEKQMFGCLAIYLHGRMVLVICSGEEPWNGLLIPTYHEFHESIRHDFAAVEQHSVLKKWLYLREASEDFESTAADIVEAIRMNDPRFGVEPGVKRGRKKEA